MTPEEQKEKQRKYAKSYYENNKAACYERTKNHPSCKAARDRYRAKPEVKERIRNSKLLKQYGITSKDYESMLETQNFCCAGCGEHEDSFTRKLNVDHDHETGLVRGLLCGGCNRALGLLKDNKKTLLSLHAYLEKYSGS